MAKLKEGPVGMLIDKIGQVVKAKWKGLALLSVSL
jgi:hypothetical protein